MFQFQRSRHQHAAMPRCSNALLEGSASGLKCIASGSGGTAPQVPHGCRGTCRGCRGTCAESSTSVLSRSAPVHRGAWMLTQKPSHRPVPGEAKQKRDHNAHNAAKARQGAHELGGAARCGGAEAAQGAQRAHSLARRGFSTASRAPSTAWSAKQENPCTENGAALAGRCNSSWAVSARAAALRSLKHPRTAHRAQDQQPPAAPHPRPGGSIRRLGRAHLG